MPNFTQTQLQGRTLTEWKLGQGEEGTPLAVTGQMAIQVTGEFGESGTLMVEGSVNGRDFDILTDDTANAMFISRRGLFVVSAPVQSIRPRVRFGDVHTQLNVSLIQANPD